MKVRFKSRKNECKNDPGCRITRHNINAIFFYTGTQKIESFAFVMKKNAKKKTSRQCIMVNRYMKQT